MRLERLQMVSVPGIRDRLDLSFGPGLNVVLGSNGSGKTSLAALVRDSLFGDRDSCRGEADLCWRIVAKPGDPEPAEPRLRHALRPHGDRLALAVDLPRLAECYFLRVGELLGAMQAEDLAEVVRHEIAGGLDPSRLRRELITLDGRRKEARRLDACERQLQQVEAAQRSVAGEEFRLGQLMEQQLAAARAGHEIPRLRARLAWLDAECERGGLLQRAAELAPVVAAMSGEECQSVVDLRQQIGVAAQARDQAGGDLERTARQLEQLGLGATPPSPALVAQAGELCAVLQRQQQTAVGTQRELKGAVQELAAMHEDGDVAPGFESDDLRRLARLADAEAVAQARCDSLAERLRWLPGTRSGSCSEDLRDSIQALSAWLSAADAAALLSRSAVPTRWLVVVALAGAALAWWWLALALLLGGIVVGLLLALGFQRRAMPVECPRARARADYQAIGLTAPRSWSVSGVRRRLRRWHEVLARTRLADSARQHAQALERELVVERAGLERCRGQRVAVAEQLGLDLDQRAPLALLVHFDRLVHGRKLIAQVARLRGESVAVLAAVRQSVAALDRILVGAGRPGLADGEAARSAIDELAAACRQHHALATQLHQHREVHAEQQRLHLELTQRKQQQFASLQLDGDDEPGLRELHRQWQSLCELRRGLVDVERRIAELQVAVGSDARLLALSVPRLEARLEARIRQHEQMAVVSEAIGGIRNQVAAASAGGALEEALVAVDVARGEVAACRDEALRRVTREFLLDLAEQELERGQRPAILQLASDKFFEFTRRAWSLQFDHRQRAFLARDNASGRLHQLAELSDGTRVQLWIAARLAFVESQEDGIALPLFLDEALSTADPDRFRAVMGVLMQLVRAGRQVFYLTANPADRAAIEQLAGERGGIDLCVLDLDVVGATSQAPRRRAAVSAAVAAAVPLPGQLSAAAYADLLEVRPPRPHMAALELDLFFVLTDRLDLLQCLRQQGFSRVGHWRAISAGPMAVNYCAAAADRELLEARCRMAEVFVNRWQHGRGRPLYMRDLEGSDLISSTFWSRVESRLEAHRHRADGLLADLDGKRVKQFRKTAALREFCERGGYLDQAPLDAVDTRWAVAAALQRECTAGLIDDALLRHFVAVMYAAMSGEECCGRLP